MKATITDKGALKITPENGLESYALEKWFEGYDMTDGKCESVLHIETIRERDEEHSEK